MGRAASTKGLSEKACGRIECITWDRRPKQGDPTAGDDRRPTARLERISERARVRRHTWARGDGLRRDGQPAGGARRRADGRRLLRRRHAHYRTPARIPAARLRYFVGPLQNLVGLIHFLLWASNAVRSNATIRGSHGMLHGYVRESG